MPKFDPNSIVPTLDGPDMLSDDHDKLPTVHLALQSDNAVLAVANSKLSSPIAVSDVTGLQAFLDDKASKDDNLKMYLAGVKKNQPKISITTAAVATGTVTFNLTDDNTSTGNALFTNVYTDSAQPVAVGISVFFGSPTLAANRKTISFPVTQVTTVLGLVTIQTAANGTACRLMIMGD